MKLISLLLASVEASKLASRASTKNKSQQYWGTEFDSIFDDLNTQLDALNNYDYSYTNDSYDDWNNDLTSWNTGYDNWWDTPTPSYDTSSCTNTDNGA